jgi:hypothetical protein
MTDVVAAAILRGFRRHEQLAAFRAGRPSKISLVGVTHGHGDFLCHSDSSVLNGGRIPALHVILAMPLSTIRDVHRMNLFRTFSTSAAWCGAAAIA